MDINRVEARFEDGTTLAIDCIAIEDEYGNTPAQRAELDWLLYNLSLIHICYGTDYVERSFDETAIPGEKVALDEKKIREQESLLTQKDAELEALR